MSSTPSVDLPHPTLSQLRLFIEFFDAQSGAKTWKESVGECDDFLREHHITQWRARDLPQVVLQLKRRVRKLHALQVADEDAVSDYKAAEEQLNSSRVTQSRKRKWQKDHSAVIAAFKSRRIPHPTQLDQEERAVVDAINRMTERGKTEAGKARRLVAEAKEQAKKNKEDKKQRKKEEKEKQKADKAATKAQEAVEKQARDESKRQQRAKQFLSAEVAVIKQQDQTLADIEQNRRIASKTERFLDDGIEFLASLKRQRRRMGGSEEKENEDPQLD